MDVHKGGGDTKLRQGMGKQVIAAAVDGLLRHNMIAGLSQRLNGIGHSRRTGGCCQSCHAAFQSSNPLFQNILGGVCQTAIDVARVAQVKPGCGMGGALKDIGGGLIDRHGSCVRCGVGLLLSHMELQCFKAVVAHWNNLFLVLVSVFTFVLLGFRREAPLPPLEGEVVER